jgi:hypothetical protein
MLNDSPNIDQLRQDIIALGGARAMQNFIKQLKNKETSGLTTYDESEIRRAMKTTNPTKRALLLQQLEPILEQAPRNTSSDR